MSRKVPPCGSYAAYQRHKRLNEKPCDDCRKACNAYICEHRKRTGNRYEKARERARHALARRFPEEYAALLAEELAKESTR